MLGNRDEYDRMGQAEDHHWWYYALHERVKNNIQNNFPENKEIAILDAGCGTGGMMSFLRNNGFRNLEGFDVSDFAEDACRSRNLCFSKFSMTETRLRFQSQTKDVIICCDSLYFLPDEQQPKVLNDFYRILKPGGIILLNLPALNIFRGTHDLSVGIKKRYHHRMLKTLLPDNLTYSFSYWPVLLSPVIALMRLWQRIKIISGKYYIKSDIRLPGSIINKLLKYMMRFELRYFPSLNFGSSLFVVVRK